MKVCRSPSDISGAAVECKTFELACSKLSGDTKGASTLSPVVVDSMEACWC